MYSESQKDKVSLREAKGSIVLKWIIIVKTEIPIEIQSVRPTEACGKVYCMKTG